jgi:exodeoxyribonuclease VII large subunit
MLEAAAALMTRRMHRVIDTHAQLLDRAALRSMRPAEGVRRHAARLALIRQRLHALGTLGIPRERQRCLDAAARLRRALAATLSARRQTLGTAAARLDALDPRQVLTRGYAWLTDHQGHAITTATALAPGQQVNVVLADGDARAAIESVNVTPRSGAA